MKSFIFSASSMAGVGAGCAAYGPAVKAAVANMGFLGKIGYSLGLVSPPFAAVAMPVVATAAGTAVFVALGLTVGKKVMEMTELAEQEGFVDGPAAPQGDAAEKRSADEENRIVAVP